MTLLSKRSVRILERIQRDWKRRDLRRCIKSFIDILMHKKDFLSHVDNNIYYINKYCYFHKLFIKHKQGAEKITEERREALYDIIDMYSEVINSSDISDNMRRILLDFIYVFDFTYSGKLSFYETEMWHILIQLREKYGLKHRMWN